MRAVDVHGFGGGFTLGAVQAGWDLIAKKSREVGFGVLNTLANRQLLGDQWESQAEEPEMWTAESDVQMVFGNPPCAGFSTLSPKHFRGVGSKINQCMWELVNYATKVKPDIVIFESVQQAYTQGLSLMHDLWRSLEQGTGQEYHLTHVLHNNLSLGGASMRKRYYWVASRFPFGVEDSATRWDFKQDRLDVYEAQYAPTLSEVLLDLEHLSLTMTAQPFRNVSHQGTFYLRDEHGRIRVEDDEYVTREWHTPIVSSEWVQQHMHDGSGEIDGHEVARCPMYYRMTELFDLIKGEDKWRQGERISDVLRRYHQRHGELPPTWQYLTYKKDPETGAVIALTKSDRLAETDFHMGHSQPVRWHGNRPANVITGGGVHGVVHPTQPRTLTQREAARIQGFPDAWKIFPVRHAADLGPGWGKGVPVHSGRWVAHYAKESLEGRPGSERGEEMGERERKINLTYAHRRFYHERRREA